jgi:hypothetical protein
MTIDALPEAPSTSDPENFDSEADAFVAALSNFVTQFNTDIAALNNLSTTSTSVTSNTIGTGSKSFTVQASKSYFVGMSLTIARTAAPANRMFGVVTSYNSTTGALVVTSQASEGSGTFTDWTITLGFNGVISAGQIGSESISQPSLLAALRKQFNQTQNFRLTLTTGVPVTTADVTGATTIYCTPYRGNTIALYDGTNWNMRTSSEFSLALGVLTASRPYDVFCYDNAGVPTLEFTAWTNDTTRATALVMQDGVLSKTGALTRRYLGTFYTTATTTTEDSATKRLLINYYHQVERPLNNSFTANRNATNTSYAEISSEIRCQFLTHLQNPVAVNINGACAVNAGNVAIATSIAFDGTTAENAYCSAQNTTGGNANPIGLSLIKGGLSEGFHYVTLIGLVASATGTWTGSGTAGTRTAINGFIKG